MCLRVGIGLRDVLALDVDAAERAIQRRVDHVGDAQARLRIQRHAPFALVDRAHRRDRRCGDSRAARAGSCPCRSFPARCSGRAAGSPRRRAGRYCRSPSPDWRAPSPRCCPGCARSRPARSRSRRCRRWRKAAPRRGSSAAGTPVIASTASGLLRGFGDERRPVGERLRIAALAHERPRSTSPSVTMTCASAVSTATLVPGRSGR